MRKVFLDDLPKKEGIGALKGREVVDWTKSVGYKVRFTYDDIEGEVNILICDVSKRKLTIKYNDCIFDIFIGHFAKCCLGKLLGKTTNEFKVKIGGIFKDDKRDLVIIDKKYKPRNGKGLSDLKWYKYKCNKCGWTEGWIEESKLLVNKRGCSCCTNRTAVLGINTIWDTDRWMCDLGVVEEYAKKNVSGSDKKIKCICPYCGETIYKSINNIHNRKSIGCKCSDGQSYISKYIYSLLKQLNLDFQTEVKYNWNKYINPLTNKESQASIDFVIYHNKREIPLEADGKFHRTDNHMNGQTKEMSESIDKQRDDNCLKYLGEETIRISDEGDIKANILNSRLSKEFNLSNIDWSKCEEFAINSNKVKEVCDYWNNKDDDTTIVSMTYELNISRSAIRKYLKQGANLNWCSYSS